MSGMRLPIVQIGPTKDSGTLGRVIGVVGGSEPPLIFSKNNYVKADIAIWDSTCYFTCRTDNGPTPPPLPKGFEKPKDLVLSKKGNAPRGFMVANDFLETAIAEMMSREPDKIIVEQEAACGSIPLWNCVFKGLDDELSVYVTLEYHENRYYQEQLWHRIFEFHHGAVCRVLEDLSGKMVTTIRKKRC